MFAGIAPTNACGVTLFNPTAKSTFVRNSFQYLSVDGPISTSYVVTATTPADEEALVGPLSYSIHAHTATSVPLSMDNPDDDYTYVHLPMSHAPSNARFSYSHLDSTFLEIHTDCIISYDY